MAVFADPLSDVEIMVATFPHDALQLDEGDLGKAYSSWLESVAPQDFPALFIPLQASVAALKPEEHLVNAAHALFGSRSVRIAKTGPNEVYAGRPKHETLLDSLLAPLRLDDSMSAALLQAAVIPVEGSPVTLKSLVDILATAGGATAIAAGPGAPFALVFLVGRGALALWQALPESRAAVDHGISGWVRRLVGTRDQKEAGALADEVALLKLKRDKEILRKELEELRKQAGNQEVAPA